MTDILVTIFGRLFESHLGAAERLVVSVRTTDGGIRSLDAITGLARLLEEPGHPEPPPDALHATLLGAFPAWTAAVSGVAPHLRDLLVEGMAMPETTSMLRKRAVPDLGRHLVQPDALAPERLPATIDRARGPMEQARAKHLLLVVTDGTVHVVGRTPEETMAHWSNVEFAARVGVRRVEERHVHPEGERDD